MYGNALFFVGILVFLFVVWVATGGPQRPISYAGPFITPITTVGGEQRGFGSIGDWNADDNDGGERGRRNPPEKDIQKSLWRLQGDVEDLQEDTQNERMFGPPSPQRGKVSISSVSGVRATSPNEETITLSVSGKEPIDISGWRVVSVGRSTGATIPGGTPLFRQGGVNHAAPIVLSPGERAILVTGRSPLGISFRENSCMGYLAERQTFHPSLSKSCPSPSEDFDRFYDGAARDFQACKEQVGSLPRCSVPGRTPGMSDSCYALVREHLSYNGCIEYHANDRNFWGKTWRVYLGQSEDLWRSETDTIKLLDEEGLTVDIRSY